MKTEIIEKRKLNEKHFLNPDGTIEAQIFNHDIHYLKNDKYEEIDNTLIRNGKLFVNRNHDLEVSFKERNEEQLVTITKEKHQLIMGLMNSNHNICDKYIYDMFDEISNQTHRQDKIEYYHVFENVDLIYQVIDKQIKEQIIIHTKEAINHDFTFQIITDLKLLKKDNYISICDEGSEIYRIEKPFMVDNHAIRNENIDYELIETNKGYELHLLLDKIWLEDEQRMFPIAIDPTITSKGDSEVKDTYIISDSPDLNRNNMDYLIVDCDDNSDIRRSFFKFLLPTIGTGSSIIDAKLNVIGYPLLYNYLPINYRNIIDIHEVTCDWQEETATWNNMHNYYNSRIEDYQYYVPSFWTDSTKKEIHAVVNQFNITNLVKKWYSGKPNYGVMLKLHNETTSDKFPCWFISKDNKLKDDVDPFISITYRNQNGLESYMSYQNYDFSHGVFSINNYNGNIVGTFPICSTIGGVLPVQLSLFYNTNDVILNHDYGFGKGYKLSIQQTIKKVIIENETMYEYTDEDGTIHYFRKQSESGIPHEPIPDDASYTDEDGLSLTLKIFDNSYQIIDKDGNIMEFSNINDNYLLTKIKNTNQKMIQIIYENEKITKIIDGNDEEINIMYGETIRFITIKDTTSLIFTGNKISQIKNKFGSCSIYYNNHDIIDYILDNNNKKLTLNYYDVIPYRLKKIQEYGSSILGSSLEFTYGFHTTTVKNHKGFINNYSFNSLGNTTCKTNLLGGEQIRTAYGKDYRYGEYGGNKNKLLGALDMLKPIINLFWNSSFEKNDTVFTSVNLEQNYSNEEKVTGLHSLKLNGIGSTFKELMVETNQNYTFSFYHKNNQNLMVKLISGETTVQETILSNTEFERNELTILTTNSNLKILFENIDITYIDDIQLEVGKVANPYNLIDNSDFSYGLAGYDLNHQKYGLGDLIATNPISSLQDELITLSNGQKVLKIKSDPEIQKTLTYEVYSEGKKGDIYYVSFWYKNFGVNNTTFLNEFAGNYLHISYGCKTEGGYCIPLDYPLNTSSEEWQFYSTAMYMDCDYDNVSAHVMSLNSTNELYVTNFTMLKNYQVASHGYDNKGNITSYRDKNESNTAFQYDNNNQLIKMTNAVGTNLRFEYDNVVKDRILRGISPTGINNQVMYDSYGNPTITKIENKTFQELDSGKYYIRNKGTNEYFKIDVLTKRILVKEDGCSHDLWQIIKEEENIIIHPIYYDKAYISSNQILDDILLVATLQENGSYTLKNDIQYLTNTPLGLVFQTEINLDYQQFFFEKKDDLYIENKAEYSSDGKFLTSTTDSLFNTTSYEVNSKGNITKMTNAINQDTMYTYNDLDQISSIHKGDMNVSYTYQNSQLSKIILGNKGYTLTYDEFLKPKDIFINNQILITNTYENYNGPLSRSVYGNNHEINYLYDSFDRVEKINKMNDTYQFYYDNFSKLRRLESNDHVSLYDYDSADRLLNYRYDDFYEKFTYNSLNKIVNKKQKLSSLEHNTTYEYDSEEATTKIMSDDLPITYEYDSLGRVILENRNGNVIKYSYITNGKRTSNLISKVEMMNHIYQYKYDKLGNIIKISLDNNTINQYFYDIYNQLVKEITPKGSIEYTYDLYGNLLNVKTYDLSNTLINNKIYQYENPLWLDQLTTHNDTLITYDEIGNPKTIGEANLTWMNGRELFSYSDRNNNITYQYNKDGIRTQKTANGMQIKYYLEGNDIIFEKQGNNVIYYLRDSNSLIGFIYNQNTYFYVKNIQNDILGILNSDLEQIATYEYDSFGKIISVKDANNVEIIDDNHIANINPFRYRSYYYDKETELYYLNSRYYSPTWGRFINADGIVASNEDIISHNLYNYCSNNYINKVDILGDSASIAIPLTYGIPYVGPIILAITLIATGLALAQQILNNSKTYKNKADPRDSKKDNNVYVLKDNNKKVQYVGRTQDVKKTTDRHKRNPYRSELTISVVLSDASFTEARVYEQVLIEHYQTLNKGNKTNNQINGLNPNGDMYQNLMDATRTIWDDSITYVGG